MSEEYRRLVLLALDPLALTAWVLIALNLMLLRQRALGIFRSAFALAALVFIVAANPLAANALQGRLEDEGRVLATCAAPPDGSVLVTLAGGIRKDTVDPNDIVQMEAPTFRRTVAAAHLALRTAGSFLLLSGGSGEQVREADLMASLAAALGVPAARIVEERISRTTYENALESRSLLRRFANRPVYLLTSAMHLPRAVAAFRSVGVAVCPFPVDFQRMDPEGVDALIPSMSALQRTAESVREFAAIALYRLERRAVPLAAPVTSGS